MNRKTELDLLVELAKLVKKYGPESFEALSDLLSSPVMTQRLPSLLKEVAKESRTNTTVKQEIKNIKRAPTPRSLNNIEESEPEKYSILMDIYNSLNDKTALPTLEGIRKFSLDHDLPRITAKTRKLAINQLINSLSGLPEGEFERIAQSFKKYGFDDRSLEGWSDIILKKSKNGESK